MYVFGLISRVLAEFEQIPNPIILVFDQPAKSRQSEIGDSVDFSFAAKFWAVHAVFFPSFLDKLAMHRPLRWQDGIAVGGI